MRSKHISSFEEVKARNAGEETQYDKAKDGQRVFGSKARAARTGKATKEEEAAEESEEEVKPVWLLRS